MKHASPVYPRRGAIQEQVEQCHDVSKGHPAVLEVELPFGFFVETLAYAASAGLVDRLRSFGGELWDGRGQQRRREQTDERTPGFTLTAASAQMELAKAREQNLTLSVRPDAMSSMKQRLSR